MKEYCLEIMKSRLCISSLTTVKKCILNKNYQCVEKKQEYCGMVNKVKAINKAVDCIYLFFSSCR